jgi:hypothetical protein
MQRDPRHTGRFGRARQMESRVSPVANSRHQPLPRSPRS